MNSYYQTLLGDVVKLFQEKKFEKASQLINEELSMPYVPAEAQQILEQYQEECRPYLSRTRHVSDEELEQWCENGSESQKERAVTALLSLNLRQYLPEVRKLLLAENLLDEFKGELIEALIEQKLDETLRIRKSDGRLVSFNPSKIVPAEQDAVIQQTKNLLDQWLSADNPSLENFCEELLKQETLERRPDDFSGQDPQVLAASLVRLVYEAMNDREGYDRFIRKEKLEQLPETPLLIEKRGEYNL